MQTHRTLRSSLVLLALSASHAVISASLIQSRATYNCTDRAADFAGRCWAELDMVDFLANPKTGWYVTTRKCDPHSGGVNDDASDCCKADEPWSTCFLRLAKGAPGWDCTTINTQSCNWSGDQAPNLRQSDKPRYLYATRAISVINNLFTTWYLATESAIYDASLIVEPVITEIDPEKKTKFSLSALLSAQLAGLPYLSSPYAPNLTAIPYVVRATSQALQNSLQTAPPVSKALWPMDAPDDTQFVTISELATALEKSGDQSAEKLNLALRLIMTDMATFIAFASSGAYTDSVSASLPSRIQGLELALKTYITTSALSANGYIARVDTNASVAAGQAECLRNHHTDPSLCENEIKPSWTDPATQLVYSMGSSAGTTVVRDNIVETLLQNNWTSAEALFAGPYACADAGLFDAGQVVNFNATQGLDLACMGRLTECKEGGDENVLGNKNLQTCPLVWAAVKA